MYYHTLSGAMLTWDEPMDAALQAFWETIVAAWRAKADYATVSRRVTSAENPLLAPTGGLITPPVWAHPVFQALMDLAYRLGIAQGALGTDGTEDLQDPFTDTWLPVSEAAIVKGVTVPGLHKAIQRGDVAARPQTPGQHRLEVSQRSLAHWTPDRMRQAARKQS
ncbi:hypothetical protein [Sulfobacillus harzensis]|uniref:Helix-turn-helix domain-containing protein n=1 Tax=Sulfobacillus harzensis TaxID=2729629 RepID=A0A7Y0L073_9FIRM|nr:hypothetical protein [Sulfobacillus harzensis]NMP20800.1 hypothetical protein [Sulfobacillus harzensis]